MPRWTTTYYGVTFHDDIDQLAKIFRAFGRSEMQCDLADAFTRVFIMSDEFLPLVKVPTQEALSSSHISASYSNDTITCSGLGDGVSSC